jgi:DsbC/DsbD-like thiol-disulfide interchange protein
MRPLALALLTVASAAWAASPAGAVHQSHHGPFVGRTDQGERIVMRVTSHTRLGIRFRWRATCESGSVLRITRFRNVPVSEEGRFFRRNRFGVGVRGKIGFDPMGNPVFPAPFSFANNEARGRLRAVVELPEKGRCTSGTVAWEAHR